MFPLKKDEILTIIIAAVFTIFLNILLDAKICDYEDLLLTLIGINLVIAINNFIILKLILKLLTED